MQQNAYKCSLERISYRQMALAFIRAVMLGLGLGENNYMIYKRSLFLKCADLKGV